MALGIFIDPSILPAGIIGFFQVLTLGMVYIYILSLACNMMADGSELLLLIPRFEKLVGSIILPVLGAVPDGAIVLFSGLGGNVEENIAIGIGTLAGSTIMLITFPYAMSIMNGLVPRHENNPMKPDYTRKNELNGAIASSSTTVRRSGGFASLTLIGYVIVQLPSTLKSLTSDEVTAESLHIYILMSAAFCLFGLAYYSYDCFMDTRDSAQRKVAASKRLRRTIALLKDGAISINEILQLAGSELIDIDASEEQWVNLFSKPLIDSNSLDKPSDYQTYGDTRFRDFEKRITEFLSPIFEDLDHDQNGSICYQEAYHLLVLLQRFSKGKSSSFGMKDAGKDDIKFLFESYDKDHSGSLNINEFCDLVWKGFHYSEQSRYQLLNLKETPMLNNVEKQSEGPGREGASEDTKGSKRSGSGSTSKMSDFKTENPTESSIMREACITLGLGTSLVLVFSDPIVDIINELGKRTGISAFYLAFIFAPLAANAAEAITSVKISASKTPDSLSVSLTALLGAAIMNNTFCLFVFLILIYFYNLKWNFGAEVGGILIAQCIMVFYSQKNTYNKRDAMVIASIYPVTLAVVAILKLF